MKKVIISLIILIFCSCLKQKTIILRYDFESPPQKGWSNINLKKGKGHSGVNFSYAAAPYMFSGGFIRKLSEITDKKINRIDIICWIRKLTDNASADFVLSLERNGTSVYWDSRSSNGTYPVKNEWTRMHCTYDLPDSIGHNEELKVYLWNQSSEVVDVDDFEIKLFY